MPWEYTFTWNNVSGSDPIQTFPKTGGVKSTVTPSLQEFTSSKISVHFSCWISVVAAWTQTAYRCPWTKYSDSFNCILINVLSEKNNTFYLITKQHIFQCSNISYNPNCFNNLKKLDLWVTSLSDTPRLQYYDVQTLEYRYISKLIISPSKF